ncbi:hypothetical protein GOBAR_AA39025 [Gossypium barbadense]|uniref:Uncharacterized protein n=1 Tax=Gossypium barbadense TaxID=3634 RepID=A0A2P5VSB2_GOSBA|nr:hypothetical protein GOBAR_AA39025 [Gossypium barbadense]
MALSLATIHAQDIKFYLVTILGVVGESLNMQCSCQGTPFSCLNFEGSCFRTFGGEMMMPNVWPFVKLALEKHRQWVCG